MHGIYEMERGVEVTGAPPYTHNGSDDSATENAPSYNSPPDEERDAEPWTRANEELLRLWCNDWSKATVDHAIQHESYTKWQNRFAIPSVALPLVLSPISSTTRPSDCEGAEQHARDTLVVLGFIACSITSALNAYFEWGVTGEKHLTASRRYADLVSDTEEILAKLRRHRANAAVTLRTLKDRSDNLLQWSPPLPISTRRRKLNMDSANAT